MSRFIQLHLLTAYPPSNLNRDDLGQPKTAVVGGTQRLRISSQSLKRAWRTSDIFSESMAGKLGVRTKRLGVEVIYPALVENGVNEKDALKWAKEIAGQFGKSKIGKKEKPEEELEIEQLAHISPQEIEDVKALIKKLGDEKRAPNKEELALMRKDFQAADIALFGRMVASSPMHNMEAAAQVSHAFTVQSVAVEDDYFTAVDDLNAGEDNAGAGHLGESKFASGVFYIYVCVNRELLKENLQNDEALTQKTLRALTEAAATIGPSGKQNSFASRVFCNYILAEKGERQPRSLAAAFLNPVSKDILNGAIVELEKTREAFDSAYWGNDGEPSATMNVAAGVGSLKEILEFVEG